MSDRKLRGAAAALAIGGAAVMSYLLVVRHTGGAPICAGNGCETVQRSSYADIFGAPVALFGLSGFLAVAVSSVARSEQARFLQAVVVLSAFGFSAYLLVVQVFVIGAVCEWCLLGDAVTTALVAVVLLRGVEATKRSA